ncbi:Golgi apyrase [Rhodotorula toruloides]|nr:Golgi apyrase [Rhodotorula toruloides]
MPPRPPPWSQGRQYGVVIDAGSSGSRIQVYSWVDPEIAKHDRKAKGKSVDVLSKVEKGVEEGDGWHLKVEPGISTFGSNPAGVPDYLRPLIEFAASVIPADKLPSTPIYLLATAGMRLLPPEQQSAVLSSTCDYLRTFPFHLPDCGEQIRIISGEEEGLYGWVAVNYLMDGFDKHEHAAAGERRKHSSTYGFLDMGGASTQIAFEPSETEQIKHADNLVEVKLRLLSGKDVRHPVFVTTWLGFGTNQARNRYVDQTIQKHLRNTDEADLPGDAEGLGSERPVVLVDDPCLPKSLMLSEARHAGYTTRGTGDFAQCLKRQAPLLNKEVDCPDEPCLFNGVHVPPIDFSVNHFIGISEYWYSTQDVWGAALNGNGVYDYVEFEKHAIEYCGREWDDIMRDYKEGGGSWKTNVELSRLEMQCFKAAWIINVLHEGIGIPRIIDRGGQGDGKNQAEKGISKAIDKNLLDEPPSFQSMNEVNDVAISWTLGKMVLEVSKGTTELPASSPRPSTYANSYGAFRMGWTGHIPSWRGDVRTTIAAVKDSSALPFFGIFVLLLVFWLFGLSPGASRRRKSFCGPLGRSSPRRSDFSLLSQDENAISSGDSSGSRTPPRGGRRKNGSTVTRALSPFQHAAIRLSSFIRSFTRQSSLSRSPSASILPMSRVSNPSGGEIFRPRPIRSSKSTPFLRSATVAANYSSSTGHWNDMPAMNNPSDRIRPASAVQQQDPNAGAPFQRSTSGSALASYGPRTSSPPPMAVVIPPSPNSRPTTPASARPVLTKLTPRSSASRDGSTDEFRHVASSSGIATPSPLSAGPHSAAALSNAVWDSLATGGFSRERDSTSPTPGVGAAQALAGAKLRTSKSANSSQVNLAGPGGYFAHAGGSNAASGNGTGSARRQGGPTFSLTVQPPSANASSTSLGGQSAVSTPGAGE